MKTPAWPLQVYAMYEAAAQLILDNHHSEIAAIPPLISDIVEKTIAAINQLMEPDRAGIDVILTYTRSTASTVLRDFRSMEKLVRQYERAISDIHWAPYSPESLAYNLSTRIKEYDPRDPQTYEMVMQKYASHEISDERFSKLVREHMRLTRTDLGGGGMLDRHRPTAMELAAYRQWNPDYKTPEEEYWNILNSDLDDIIVVATEDEENICICSVPPEDPEKRVAYGQRNRDYFRKVQMNTHVLRRVFDEHADKLMEVKLILRSNKPELHKATSGIPFRLLNRAIRIADRRDTEIRGIFAEHFGPLRRIEPTPDERTNPYTPNESSSNFFKKLDIGPVGTSTHDRTYREVRSDLPEIGCMRTSESGEMRLGNVLIGAEVTWITVYGEYNDARHSLGNYIQSLKNNMALYRAVLENKK